MPPTNPTKYMLCTGECVLYEDLYKHPNSHIIGHLRYVVDEQKKVTALARWDVSESAGVVPPLEPVIDCEFIGDARNIKCKHADCTNTVRWEIGKAALDVLFARREKLKEIVGQLDGVKNEKTVES